MAGQRFFAYGWFIVAIGWICYGFGISPAYYSWGIFARSVMTELDYDRGQIGAIFGLFTLLYSCVGPLVGMSQTRFGVRWTMVGGFISTAVGLYITSIADTPIEFYLGFSILGGGIGFATIVPCQTLGQNWFLKRRALALALIFTSGGIVGRIVAAANNRFVGIQSTDPSEPGIVGYDWREGWLMWAAVSLTLAVVAGIFVRDTPEHVGQHRDGTPPSEDDDTDPVKAAINAKDDWTAKQAMRTPQFKLMILCGCAYAVPWGVVVGHLALHLTDIGFAEGVAGAFVGTMALISIAGRLGGALGDWFSPQLVLGASLLMEGLGVAGLLIAQSQALVYVCITLIALGFGIAYISVPVVFSAFFGRRAFGMTSGVRIFITGIFNGAGPWVAGMIFDATESYAIPFIALTALCAAGAVSAVLLKDPGLPES